MQYFPSATHSFDDLVSHPIKWIAVRLAIYLSAAVMAGLVFILGAAIYAHLWPQSAADTSPGYDVVPHEMVPMPKRLPAPNPMIGDALIAGYIGAPIKSEGIQIGVVEGILMGSDNSPVSIVIGRTDGTQPQRIIVPYDKVLWAPVSGIAANRFDLTEPKEADSEHEKSEHGKPEPATSAADSWNVIGVVDRPTLAASTPVQRR